MPSLSTHFPLCPSPSSPLTSYIIPLTPQPNPPPTSLSCYDKKKRERGPFRCIGLVPYASLSIPLFLLPSTPITSLPLVYIAPPSSFLFCPYLPQFLFPFSSPKPLCSFISLSLKISSSSSLASAL